MNELMDVMIFHEKTTTSIINVKSGDYVSAVRKFFIIKGKDTVIDMLRQYDHDESYYIGDEITGEELEKIIDEAKK